MKKLFAAFAVALVLVNVIVDVSMLSPADASGSITIEGHLTYSDQFGFPRPMRRVLVRLLGRGFNWWGDTWTDYNDGRYSFTVSNEILNEYVLGLLVCAENSGAARCENTDGDEYTWWLDLSTTVTQPNQVYSNLDFRFSQGSMLNKIWFAIEACLNMSYWVASNTNPPFMREERVTIIYPDNSRKTPWTDPYDEDIHLMDPSVTPWNEITVFHEYAHAIMHADELYSWDDFPEGDVNPDPHYLESESCPEFAFTEGWAEFMESLMYKVQGGSYPPWAEQNDYYNVTDAGDWDGNIVEGAVAGILYDIWDPVDPTDNDLMSRPFEDIFNVIFPPGHRDDELNSINDFWNRWIRLWLGLDTSIGPLCFNYWNHGIDKDSALGLAPDTGSMVINGRDEWVSQPDGFVVIDFDPSWAGGSGVQYVRFRNENDPWGDWVDYQPQIRDYPLSKGDGPKRVYAQFMDKCGHISTIEFYDDIKLDNTPPTGKMTIEWMGDTQLAKEREVTLHVECNDHYGGSGVTHVRFKHDGGFWQNWEPYTYPCTKPWTLVGSRGLIRVYCQALDRAGNTFEFYNETIFTDAKYTKIFFNLNPNPAVEHESVQLKGIVVDEDSNPVPPTPEPAHLFLGEILLSYRSLWSDDPWQSRSLRVYEGGAFSIQVDELGLDLSGEICFKARYRGGFDYIDSEAQACLRFTSSEVQSPDSSLYFNINPSHPLHDGSAMLTGILLDNNGLPIRGNVYTALSVDDGANWESEGPYVTDDHGIFHRFFRFASKGGSKYEVGTSILVRARYGQVNKTAYMRITDQIEFETPTMLAYDWNPLNLIRTRLTREVYLGLPTGYARFIDPTSLAINNTITVAPECMLLSDINSDSILDLTLALNTSAISQFILSMNITTGNVTLLLTGRFYDNTLFGQTMLIKVRMPGDINIDGEVDMKDVSLAAQAFGTREGNTRWNPIADENEDGIICMKDLALVCRKFGMKYT